MPLQELEPAACSMWDLHHRLGEEINSDSCAQLLDSIKSNGQKHPALGRPCERRGRCVVELIYGARRLFVAQTLGRKLLVDVREIDDKAALVEMDIENRVRTDISPYERGLSYKRWLCSGVFSTQTELAKSLAISEAQVSRLLSFAELPAVVVGAFDTGSAIREDWAVTIARECRDPERRKTIVRRARDHVKAGHRLPSPQLYASLVASTTLTPKLGVRDTLVKDDAGTPILRIAFRTDAVHFIVPRAQLSNELLDAVTHRLRSLLQQDVLLESTEQGDAALSQLQNVVPIRARN